MSKHTPGPWTLNHEFVGAALQGHIPLSAPTHGEFAQIVWNMEDGDGDARCQATARLIAAAPDLLNALRTLADAAESRGIPVDAARAAIAKAEGKS